MSKRKVIKGVMQKVLSSRKDKLKRKAKKKVKIFILTTVIVLCMLATPIIISLINTNSIIKRASRGKVVEEWENEDKNRNLQPASYEGDVYVDINGGLSGFGIDLAGAINGTTPDNAKRALLQVTQLYDAASLETGYPCTLYGLALLTKETSLYSRGSGSDKAIDGYTIGMYFDEGQCDIYKYRMSSTKKGSLLPPSNRAGGKVWHNISNTWSNEFAGKYVEKTDSRNNGYNFNSNANKYGYFNAGAFGIVQIEGDTWLNDYHYYRGVTEVSETNGHLVALNKNEDFVKAVFNSVGHPDFLNEYSATSGFPYSSYMDFVKDLGNMSTNVMATVTYAVGGDPFLEGQMGDKALTGDLGTKYFGEEWLTLTEEEKNVVTVMCWLCRWNGGNYNCIVNTEARKRIAIDLAKFLVAKGAQPFYDAGWVSLSNKTARSASNDEIEKLRKYLTTLVDILYENDGAGRSAAWASVSEFLSTSCSSSYNQFLYCLDGIIRAQKAADNIANDASYGGEPFNVYRAKYTGESTYEEIGTELVADIVSKVIEYGRVHTGCEYSQSERMLESADPLQCKFDCSSFVARALNYAGYSGFMLANGTRTMGASSEAKKLVDGGATIVYKAEYRTDCNKKVDNASDNVKKVMGGYGRIQELMNGDYSRLQPGDLIFWDYSDTEGSYMCIDHIGIYLGNGTMLESNTHGVVFGYNIYGTDRIALVMRLNDDFINRQ